MSARLAVASTLLLASCGLTTMFEQTLPPLTTEPLLFSVQDASSVATDAQRPTDLVASPDGGFLVVDGYRHRLIRLDASLATVGEVALDPSLGMPVRAAVAADGEGWWLTAPAHDVLHRIDASGAHVRSLEITLDAGRIAPGIVAVHDAGEALVVGLEDGRVAYADPTTGEVQHTIDTDVDGVPFGAITDLSATADGSLLVTDAFGAKVHVLDVADGTPRSWVGHFGMWIGYLMKPKSAAPGPGGTLVIADSELGALQVFEPDGAALGVLAVDGEVLRLGHPIAVRTLVDGSVLALDSADGMLWRFVLDAETVATQRDAVAARRHLRTALIEGDQDARLAGGTLCYQCHDGTILDDREVWDPALGHHPIDVVPDGEVPDFFPLADDGRIVCTTCHSPHGVVEVDEVQAVEEGAEVRTLVRHAPQQEGDLFTRLSRSDSELCIACHTDAAHDQVLDQVGLAGTSHPTGRALADALAERGGQGVAGLPAGVDENCLTCHAIHGASRDGLRRDTASGEVCMSCHADKALAARNHPLGAEVGADLRVLRAALPTGLEGTQTCQTCHELVGGDTRALLQRPERGTLCTTCHDPDKLEGPHGGVKGRVGQSCLGCHDVHDAPAHASLLTTLDHASDGDPSGCASCHGPGGTAYTAAAQPGVHGHPVASAELTCADCHDAHQPGDPPTCLSCHTDLVGAVERGGHGDAACESCHPVHAPEPTLAASLVPSDAEINPRSQRCLACHAPGTAGSSEKVQAYEHPAPVFTPDGQRWTPLGNLPLYDADGARVSEGRNGALTCSSCHQTHGPSAEKPGDKLRRPGWEEACASCHGGEALVLYRFFHNPRAREAGGGAR